MHTLLSPMCTGHLHICTEEGVHLHMLTIVKMDICTYGQLWTIVDNCGHGQGHAYCVMQLTSPYIERGSSETWGRLKKVLGTSLLLLSPQYTGPLQNKSSSKRNLCNQCNSCHQSTRGPLQHKSSSKRDLCNQCNSCHQSTRGHP